MVCHEDIVSEHSVTFLSQCIDELFIKCTWWQKMHRKSFLAIDKGCFVFTLNREFRNKTLLAMRALHRVIGLVLSEQAEQLLLFERFLTMLALLLQLNVEAALENLAQFDDSILRLYVICR